MTGGYFIVDDKKLKEKVSQINYLDEIIPTIGNDRYNHLHIFYFKVINLYNRI